MTATFDEPMDPATISTSTFTLRDPSNAPVAASVQYNAAHTHRDAHADAVRSFRRRRTRRSVVGGPSGVADLAGNAMSADSVWSFTTAAPPADDGPGGPILVIGSSANPFGRYYGEILQAEGLNEYRGTDIANVTPAVLSSYHVVILGDMTLTAAQATMLSELGDGRRQARRDASRQPARGSSRPDQSAAGRCRTRTSRSTRASRRGRASPTRRSSTTAPPTSTSCPARRVSRRSTATRRPRPTYPGGDAARRRDERRPGGRVHLRPRPLRRLHAPGQPGVGGPGARRPTADPIRRPVLRRLGVAIPQPDWVNLDKVAIPQADEQQRLLANLVLQMESSRMPLPRFWYLPRGDKAVVVMTGDDHGNGGTAGRFDEQIGRQPARLQRRELGVRAQHVVRLPEHAADRRAGRVVHEPGLRGRAARHAPTAPTGRRSRSRTSTATQLAALARRRIRAFPGPFSNRTHCIVESDYSTQPHVELANGIRLDTNYYYWPPEWIQDRPGLFTGSGMPMRFADPDGSAIDVYQAATQMTDESGQTLPGHDRHAARQRARAARLLRRVHREHAHRQRDRAAAPTRSSRPRRRATFRSSAPARCSTGSTAATRPRSARRRGATTSSPSTSPLGATANGLQAMLPMTSADGAVLTSITRSSTNVAVHDADHQGRVVCRVRQSFGELHGDVHARHDAAGDQQRRRYRDAERRRDHHVDDQRAFELERRVRNQRQLAQLDPI